MGGIDWLKCKHCLYGSDDRKYGLYFVLLLAVVADLDLVANTRSVVIALGWFSMCFSKKKKRLNWMECSSYLLLFVYACLFSISTSFSTLKLLCFRVFKFVQFCCLGVCVCIFECMGNYLRCSCIGRCVHNNIAFHFCPSRALSIYLLIVCNILNISDGRVEEVDRCAANIERVCVLNMLEWKGRKRWIKCTIQFLWI